MINVVGNTVLINKKCAGWRLIETRVTVHLDNDSVN